MLARTFLVGVMALAILPVSHAQQRQQDYWFRLLLIAANVSEEIIGMDVIENGSGGVPGYITVDLKGSFGTVSKLAGMTIQVWLLRSDGTTVTQQETPPCSDCATGIFRMDSRLFTFASVPAEDLVGVVVSVNGKLYVREIKPW